MVAHIYFCFFAYTNCITRAIVLVIGMPVASMLIADKLIVDMQTIDIPAIGVPTTIVSSQLQISVFVFPIVKIIMQEQ